MVTGQAVPPLAAIDGRPMSTETLLADAELLVGSIVSTGSESIESSSGPAVNLVQVTGYGAGSIRRLTPGRFHVGPGRRVTADELNEAPVAAAAFELHVDDQLLVKVLPAEANAPELAGDLVRASTPWTGGLLQAGGRVFAIESPAHDTPRRSLPRPDPSGTVPFNRPPRHHRAPDRSSVVDAARDAAGLRDALWHRRLTDPDALTLQFGLDSTATESMSLNLAGELGAVVAGSARFRYALTRTLLLELTTMHGPADVDVVVATRPELLANWDWAKWLPHTRLHSTPSLLSSDADYDRWLAEHAHRMSGLIESHLTLVVVDAPELWLRRESPMRATLLAPPPDLRLHRAVCIEPDGPSDMQLDHRGDGTRPGAVRVDRGRRRTYTTSGRPSPRPTLRPRWHGTSLPSTTTTGRHRATADPTRWAMISSLRHAVFGRPLSPLERRLDPHRRSSDLMGRR